jgi:hypothetical protein
VTTNGQPHRSRAAEAFRALDAGSELTKHRVWRRVEQGLADDRRRARRRLGWASGVVAGVAVAAAITMPAILGAARSWYEPSHQEEQRVAVSAVMEMLGQQYGAAADGSASSADSDQMAEFAQYLVTSTEAKTGTE